MMEHALTVAAVQLTSRAEVKANLMRAERLVRSAADSGAGLICLPENFAMMGSAASVREAVDAGMGEQVRDWLSHLAERTGCWISGGTLPLTRRPDESPVDDQRLRAASLLMSPTGVCIARYDKVHLFDAQVDDPFGQYRESDLYEPGDRCVTAALQPDPESAEEGPRLGLSVCYDLRFSWIYQQMCDAGALIALLPSAFTYQTGRRHFETLLRARAIEFQQFFIAAAQCGWHDQRRRTWGHSMIVGPDGQILTRAGELEEGYVTANLDFRHQQQIRQAMPVQTHRQNALARIQSIQA